MTGTVATAFERVLQALAAARDDQVDDAVLRRQLGQLLAPAAGDAARSRRRAAPACVDRLGAIAGSTALEWVALRRPAQHDRVARLQAQRGAVDRHVRPRLVDDGDDAERHAHPAHLEAVGSRSPSITSPTGSGSAATARAPSAIAGERARVERAAGPSAPSPRSFGAAGLEVARVGLEDLRRARDQRVRDRVQRRVLGRVSSARERARRRPWRRGRRRRRIERSWPCPQGNGHLTKAPLRPFCPGS